MVSLASQDQIQRKIIPKSKSCDEEEIKTYISKCTDGCLFFQISQHQGGNIEVK